MLLAACLHGLLTPLASSHLTLTCVEKKLSCTHTPFDQVPECHLLLLVGCQSWTEMDKGSALFTDVCLYGTYPSVKILPEDPELLLKSSQGGSLKLDLGLLGQNLALEQTAFGVGALVAFCCFLATQCTILLPLQL